MRVNQRDLLPLPFLRLPELRRYFAGVLETDGTASDDEDRGGGGDGGLEGTEGGGGFGGGGAGVRAAGEGVAGALRESVQYREKGIRRMGEAYSCENTVRK